MMPRDRPEEETSADSDALVALRDVVVSLESLLEGAERVLRRARAELEMLEIKREELTQDPE
jgi:hypothetical protein